MIDDVKDTIENMLFDMENYFVPFCFNKDWNKLYAIDKIKLIYIIDNNEWSFYCEKTMINEMVYSIIISFDVPMKKTNFINYEIEPIKNNNNVNSIQIFITKKDITKIKNELYKDNEDNFWKDIL